MDVNGHATFKNKKHIHIRKLIRYIHEYIAK